MKDIKLSSNIKVDKATAAQVIGTMTGLTPDQGLDSLSGQALTDAKRAETIFTDGIVKLRNEFPNPHINQLMREVYDAFHYRKVLLALGPDVPSVSFAVMPSGTHQAMVFLPKNFLATYDQDPIFVFGGLVYVGCQVRAYVNKIDFERLGPAEMERRSAAMEAEYLITVKRTAPDFKPNDYQQNVLKAFPNGLVGYETNGNSFN